MSVTVFAQTSIPVSAEVSSSVSNESEAEQTHTSPAPIQDTPEAAPLVPAPDEEKIETGTSRTEPSEGESEDTGTIPLPADTIEATTALEETVSTIAAARQAQEGRFTLQGVVTAVDGKSIFIQDSTAGICVFLKTNDTVKEFTIGKEVQATGTLNVYREMLQLQLAENTDITVTNASADLPAASEVASISVIGEELEGMRIKVSGAIIGDILPTGNTLLTDSSGTIIIRKLVLPVGSTVSEGDTIDIIGVVGQFDKDYQIFIGDPVTDIVVTEEALDRVQPVTAAPTAGKVAPGTEVILTTATADAQIQYKLGAEGTYTNYIAGTTKIIVNEEVTLYAKASKTDMRDSIEALFAYTVDAVSSIAQARGKWTANPVEDKNKLVTVSGIVTFVDGKSYTIQDDEAGICVRYGGSLKLGRGDKITAIGYLSQYNGLLQINPANDKVTVEATGQKSPLPVTVTLKELSDPAKAEAYESRRIQIMGAVLGAVNTGGDTPLIQGDSSLNMFKIPDPAPLKQGDLVNVVGVLGQFNVYQIRVADAKDITSALQLVISEVYGAGGNAGAYYKNDYIELYNPTSQDISLTGWSIQYASSAGTSFSPSALSGTIKAGSYYLIQCSAGAGGTIDLPKPDFTNNFNMSGTSGIVTLSNSTAKITGKDDPAIVDLVGYGSGAKLFKGTGPTTDTGNNRESHQRKDNDGGTTGATNGYNANDNKNDFYPAECTPRNSSFVYVDAPTITLAPSYDGAYGGTMDVTILSAHSKESTLAAVEIAVTYNTADELKWTAYPIDGNVSKVENLVKQVKVLPTKSSDVMTVYARVKDAAGNYSKKNAEATVNIKNLPAVGEFAPNGGVGENGKPDILVKVINSTKYDIKVSLVDDAAAPKELIKSVDQTASEVTGKFTELLPDGIHKMKAELIDKSISGHTYVFSQEWTFRVGVVNYQPFFGQLHAHTAESDGTGTLAEAYAWARDKADLDFMAITDHSNWYMQGGTGESYGTADSCLNATTVEGTGNSKWIRQHAVADEFNKPNDPTNPFVTLVGFEMTWNGSTSTNPYILNGKKMPHGHMNTFNTAWFADRNDSKMQDMEKYYDRIAQDTQSISQFNHPGTLFGSFKEFGSYKPEYDNVINLLEVGNGEGPIRGTGYFPSYDEYNKALDKGWHVAPTNNQDNHKKGWGTANDARSVVLAPSINRDELKNAMRERHVYATEDKNLVMSYFVNGEVMGTILNNPTNLAMEIKISDPDRESIGKISIITNGGKTVASKNFSESTAEWKLELRADNAYYYVRVDQPDKDIAVSAPIWTGKEKMAGATNIAFEKSLVKLNESLKLNVELYNNNTNSSVKVDRVEIWKDEEQGEPVWTQSINQQMIGATFTGSYDFPTSEIGKLNYIIKVTMNINDVEEAFYKSLVLRVENPTDTPRVMIDAAHRNNYVSGYYNGKMTSLEKFLNGRGIFLEENKQRFSDAVLQGVDILIISDPCTREIVAADKEKVKYTQAELDAIKKYMDNGGNLIMSSERDSYDIAGDKVFSKDYQLNQILVPIGSALRANDDTICQGDANNYRMYYTRYGESPKYNLTANIGYDLDDSGNPTTPKMYSSYAGASLYVDEGNANKENIEVLVKLHEDCFQDDKDRAGDMMLKEGDQKFSLAAEILPSGGRLVVGGSTFFSDFEIDGSNAAQYSNIEIFENILGWMMYQTKNTTIAHVQKNADNMQDQYVEIKGRVTTQPGGTSKRLGRSNSFFDVMYVQDATGGITVFGVSERDIPLGTEVIVRGFVDEYAGDVEIQLDSEQMGIVVLNTPVKSVQPRNFATKDITKANMGWLAQIQGKVVRMDDQNLYVNDGTGEARIFVEGYIGSSSGKYAQTGKWDPNIKVGRTISACGMISMDPEGNRMRVRDTDEIVLRPVPEGSYPVSVEVIGGTATVDVDKGDALPDDVVTIDITNIEPGKQFKTITAQEADEAAAEITVTQVTTGVPEGTLRYSFTMPAKAVQVKIELKPTDKEIIGISNPEAKTVAYDTDVSKLDLPATVTVTLEDNSKQQINVDWNTSNYDGNTSGDYSITGRLVLSGGIINSKGLTAEIMVTVRVKDKPIPPSKDALLGLINVAKEKTEDSKYTQDSRTALAKAIQAAQSVADNVKSTEKEITDAIAVLQSAIDALVKVSDPADPDPGKPNSATHTKYIEPNLVSSSDLSDKIAESDKDVSISVRNNYKIGTSFLSKLMSNKDKTVTLNGDWYSWIFESKNIENDMPGTIWFDTRIAKESPNAEAIAKLVGGIEVTNLYFYYHGELPGKTKIRVKLADKANKTFYLYYFNTGKNKFELIQSGLKANEDGWVDFIITHCSDYILSEKEITGAIAATSQENANPETGGVLIQTQQKTEQAVETEAKEKSSVSIKDVPKNSGASTVIWVSIVLLVTVVSAGIFLKRKYFKE